MNLHVYPSRRASWTCALAALLLSSAGAIQAAPQAAEQASAPATAPKPSAVPVSGANHAAAKPAAATTETFSHGYFEQVPVYRPSTQPQAVALLLSDIQGWTAKDAELAESLRQQGVLTAGIDLKKMMRAMQADEAECLGPQGDLDNFSRFLQARYQLSAYRLPILVGRGAAGSALVYGVAATAPEHTFSGAVSLEFAPQSVSLSMPLCKDYAPFTQALASATQGPTGSNASKPTKSNSHHTRLQASRYDYAFKPASKLAAPWLLFAAADSNLDLTPYAAPTGAHLMVPDPASGPVSLEQQLHAAFARLEPHQQVTAAPPAAVGDLPLVEAPSHNGPQASNPDLLALMLSGDGGWAGIDKDLAAAMNRAGLPVIGFDSLRYFWKARSPESTARDVERVLRYYQSQNAWKRSKVLLIGYSQGADVLPFVVNRLPADLRAQLASVVLIGLGKKAAFEFHVSNWLKSDDQGLPILPEAERLPAKLALCVYGTEDEDAICPRMAQANSPVRVLALKGDHHFNGDYDRLASVLLRSAVAPDRSAPSVPADPGNKPKPPASNLH